MNQHALLAQGMRQMSIDHYMVDYANEAGDVLFANDTPLRSLSAAKALASKTSLKNAYGAYVVAYTAEGADFGTFKACGHISFYDGRQCDTDGVVL